MKPVVDLRLGDCLAVMRTLPDESISAVITDPPYGLAELKPAQVVTAVTAWASGDREHVPDGRGFMGRTWDAFVPPPAVWDECLRVLKPGGHLAVFAGSRTADLMGLSIRLAGFEIRDGLQWLYGSGMPKGRNVGDGWNTALKPAHEPIILARRPMPGTVAANVLAHGTGAMHVDACRTAHDEPAGRPTSGPGGARSGGIMGATGAARVRDTTAASIAGRWPTNVLLGHADECANECAPGCVVSELDAQSGITKDGVSVRRNRAPGTEQQAYGIYGSRGRGPEADHTYGGEGGASRFFPSFRYQAKAPSAERPTINGKGWPTVKPQGLMRWLVRLLCPPDGVVLDPFGGTASTGQAARTEGFESIVIERDPFAYALALQRLAAPVVVPEPEPPALFDLLGDAS